MATRLAIASVLASSLVSGVLSLPPAQAAVTVDVDPGQDARPISPLIYGANFASDAQITAGRLTLTRWGGNRTTRYNYQIDVSNTGADYYFENIPGCWSDAQKYCAPPTADPLGQSGANQFLRGAAARGLTTLFTIPTIGWIAKGPPAYGHPFPCGFPRSAAATQDSFDPYDSNCGNGKRGGATIAPPAASTTSVAVDPAWAGQWVAYLTAQHGPSNGRRIYALDNEPALWSSTHRDIRTTRLGYDELWQRMRDYAEAILQADPTALIAGPAEWGWPNYFCSDADVIQSGCSDKSPDRLKHGGVELTAWLLQQARLYEQQHGRRILHYLDLHYYPQGGDPPEYVRSLWDPTYRDPSWINDTIRLLPRMREWAAQHYPGTRLLLSEYDLYHHDEVSGALAYAEALGVFGREGLDAATAWSAPAATEAAFGAFKLYRDFDGQGGAFESTSVRATVSGDAVRAYAAVGPGRLTVALVNESASAQSVSVRLGSFQAAGSAAVYTGSGAALQHLPDVPISANAALVALPARSFAMVVATGQAPPLPDFAAPQDGSVGPADGGSPPGDPAGGCGCQVAGRTPPPGWPLLLLALALLRRRRRRR